MLQLRFERMQKPIHRERNNASNEEITYKDLTHLVVRRMMLRSMP